MDNQRNLIALKEFVYDPTGGKLQLRQAEVIEYAGKHIFMV
jgi:hypothetical protein